MENNELFKVKAVENTPFALLNKEEKIRVVIGNNIVSPEFSNETEALDYINEKSWELLTATIGVISESIYSYKNYHINQKDK